MINLMDVNKFILNLYIFFKTMLVINILFYSNCLLIHCLYSLMRNIFSLKIITIKNYKLNLIKNK